MSDKLVEELQTVTNPPVPKEWQPFASDDGTKGTGAALLPRPWNTHNDLLLGAGFDPREWRISGRINTRKWMNYDKEWLYYYKFDVEAGEAAEVIQEHIDDLTKHIRRKRPPAANIGSGEDAWAYWIADWQIGKREGDNGTEQTVDRVLESYDLAEQQIKHLRRLGRKMPHGVFFGLGDIVEGTCGFYPGMSFMIDRNRREQGRINRELISHGIDRLLPYFDTLTVGGVGGNHGENRSPKGERITDIGDNDDVAIFEAIKEAFDRGGEDRIDWVIPEDELALQLELGGVGVGVTHGHLFKGSLADLSAQKGAVDWWRGQDFGYQEIRGAQVLVSGHFHHASMNTFGLRSHFQCGPMDPGSQWVVNRIGEAAPASVLTMRFDASQPLGWADVQLLSPSAVR
jgi:hypothetical protein